MLHRPCMPEQGKVTGERLVHVNKIQMNKIQMITQCCSDRYTSPEVRHTVQSTDCNYLLSEESHDAVCF